jgi:apolipoprotein N-acyltransferase
MFLPPKRCHRGNNCLSGSSELGRSFSNLAEDFIYSGTTALLLLVANLFPGYWYFSFIALFPFLWRINKASAREAFRLGFLLGLTFFTFWSLDALLVTPASAILKIIGGTLLFALWGWAVGLAKQVFGFNPIIVSGLWVFFELGLIKLGYTSGLLTHSTPSTPFFLRLITLFGFGIISFIVVFLNSLLVKAVLYAVKLFKTSSIEFKTTEKSSDFSENHKFFNQKFFLTPQLRGPPVNHIAEKNISDTIYPLKEF